MEFERFKEIDLEPVEFTPATIEWEMWKSMELTLFDVITFFVERYANEELSIPEFDDHFDESTNSNNATWVKGEKKFTVSINPMLHVDINLIDGSDVVFFFSGSVDSFYEESERGRFDAIAKDFRAMMR